MAGHGLSNFIGTNESFYIGNRLTPTALVANINMAAAFHCFETPIWWTCLVKTLYIRIRLHLWYVTGSGKGARLLRVRLRLNFAASRLICKRHQLRRLQQPRLVRVCIFAGPRKRMYESRLKIIPIDISFVWC